MSIPRFINIPILCEFELGVYKYLLLSYSLHSKSGSIFMFIAFLNGKLPICFVLDSFRMNDSITNDTGQVDHLSPLEVYFYIINGTLGTIFNTVVLLIALGYADTYEKPRQIIVINMTWADLMTCLVYMITRPYISLMPEQLCYSYYVVIFTSQMCSCLNLLW